MRVHMGQCIHIYFLPLTSKEAWNQWHSSSNKHTQCSDRSHWLCLKLSSVCLCPGLWVGPGQGWARSLGSKLAGPPPEGCRRDVARVKPGEVPRPGTGCIQQVLAQHLGLKREPPCARGQWRREMSRVTRLGAQCAGQGGAGRAQQGRPQPAAPPAVAG